MSQYKGLENKKILVVEDVELNQFLARHIMESWGCEVYIVENGALAVEKINTEDFDIVLMDIQMPVMDGIQATRQIREIADDYKSSIPIVALTANAMKSDFDIYLKAGMNDCLPKPFEEPALFRTVSKNIRKDRVKVMDPVASEAAAVQEPVVKIYDLSMVEAISGGDKSFVLKMLQLFLDTAPATLKELKSLSDQAAWPEAGKVAHKLKSTIDSMGIMELKPVIREIEMSGRMGEKTESVPALVDRVMETMAGVMAAVRRDHGL